MAYYTKANSRLGKLTMSQERSLKKDPIPRRKLSHEVRDRLVGMIESGELQPGDKMPSEHDLMELFQVGRPAVREAMQALENMGLLSIHHGERATVRTPTAQGIIEQINLATRQMLMNSYENVRHLQEARQMFEAGVVRKACQKATPRDIEKLGRQLRKMKDNLANRREFQRADRDFHIMIADMSQNPIFASVARALFRWLGDYHQSLLGVAGLEKLTLEEHEQIFERIQADDPEGAARAIGDHILRVNKLYPKDI